ncbi:glycosyltransferase family 39 protein [Acidocella facilis]|uniref:glycosyltransferase family 39 protein n=1 Tax=Acidocella facilis TaxID=525 RepID=UPI00047D0E26|nr:glycosyltransferase family 39 protein [Acidocella facilis]
MARNGRRAELILLALAGLLLVLAAWLRGPEYDEAYSIFLTAGHARPAWPQAVFTAGSVRWLYAPHGNLGQIAHDLRQGDVHPPLYFWLLEGWRRVAGAGWFTARLLSVGFTLAGLAGLARLANLRGVAVAPVLMLALLSYGFLYTGILARPFALAQALDIWGVYALLRGDARGAILAGLCFGAAAFTDYLAVFTAGPALLWLAARAPRRAALLVGAMLPFLAACFWFFLAQHASRGGQFAAFAWSPALAALARDGGAALFGGLPLYAGGLRLAVTLLLALLALAGAGLAARRADGRLFLGFAAAAPCGLLALGVIFHNTPIEIRYLAFALPWVALAIAPGLPRPLLALWLGLGALASFGLMVSPLTMQPQGRAAHLAAAWPGAVVALPFGNDGVGVPGPFIAAAPDAMRLLLLRPGDVPPPGAVRVAIRADGASRAVSAAMGCAALVCGP